MIDLSGTEVASYVYDAWGNIKDTRGEPTIRELNPIRYRGYVYDTEVDLKKFNKKLPNGGGWQGPGGWKIAINVAKHAGSDLKLLDKTGKRMGLKI